MQSSSFQDAWAEWHQLCSTLRPLFRIEGEVGKLDGLLEDDKRSSLVTPERCVRVCVRVCVCM